MKLKKLKIQCSLEASFYDLGSKQANKQAERDIQSWIKETLQNECSFIPIYHNKTERNEIVEGSTKKTKIKVKKQLGKK